MAEERWRNQLGSDDRMEVRLLREKREVLDFSVQYLAFIQARWHAIVRFDTSHGDPHRDVMWPDGRKETFPVKGLDKAEAFTYAIDDIRERWRFYRQRYVGAMGNG